MNIKSQFEEYGLTNTIFKKLSKHEQNIFKNSWRALKAKNSFNKTQKEKDLKELIAIFYDEDWNVVYNESKLLENTPFKKKKSQSSSKLNKELK